MIKTSTGVIILNSTLMYTVVLHIYRLIKGENMNQRLAQITFH